MTVADSRRTLTSLVRSPRTAVLCAFLVRVVVLALSQHFADVRSHHYQSQGFEAIVLTFALVSGHGYSFPFPNFVATAWLAPVYVWILTLGNLLFPKNGDMVILFGLVLNILFSALTCYPIFTLGEKVAGKRIGLIAAWTWVFLPIAILMPIAFTWDQSLAALLMAQLFVFSYTLAETSSLWSWCGYGLLWGVAALTNPALFILAPCFGIWFWLGHRKMQPATTRPLALATLACILVLLPWMVRNWYRLGGFTFVKSNFGVELWLGNNPEVKSVWTPMRSPLFNSQELERMVSSGELNYSHGKELEALAFIKSHPATFARHAFNRFLDNWTAYYDSKTDSYIEPMGIRPLYILFSALFAIAALVGIITLMARDWWQWLPLACAVVIFPIPYYITHTSQRYRHPIDPILTVLAVFGLSRIRELLREPVGAASRYSASPDLKASVPTST